MVNKIKVGFLAKGGEAPAFDGCGAVLYGFGVTPSVSFKSELSGRSEVLAELGRASSGLDGLLFSGVVTDNYGVRRSSIVATEKNRLIGMSDATRADRNGSASFGYKIYNSRHGRFGVLVGNDLFAPGAVKTLAEAECDAIIDISAGFSEYKAEILVEALAFMNGIAVCFLCGNTMLAASAQGELIYNGSGAGEFFLPTKPSYREFTVKRRGI